MSVENVIEICVAIDIAILGIAYPIGYAGYIDPSKEVILSPTDDLTILLLFS